ncbi:MAG TPA: ethanolamine utilization protein EutJ [Alcanivorax sp.]|jgi:branched-chain amino acid transport system substrate-binding protein|uniref:ABC transporter substrate-binding protein n=1 Tax=Alloalcanivorax venustensis TaxID=172371 RepID=UPI000C4CE7C3|nr:ethanolamine utilization protein EutJ [Alcanivorax sp.]MAQ34388.1 ethanolamine utilization protein EutJ [Alcanivorax sp.]MBA4731845.1 ABC transporter substrate-binding protein [Alcanivorax sp.]MBT76330.1 ethanolamine utilization protein EutJ [Alcanivorax sp.]HAB08812.1 ethanolamine utilization protein EutJ [Alcanivorax sp.]|tara:strand:- start:3257 stop:4420 length:1164 start_codon:yes stop_codon:yes gene_type:complete
MKVLKSFRRLAAASAVALAIGGAAHADEVNIGFTGPLSGGAALYGENTLEGLRMAAEEINAAGGITVDGEKHTINIQALDDKYSPSQAAVNGKRLVQQYNAPVIFTPHSGGTFALQAFNERDGFLVMSYTSVPAVTSKGNKLTVKIPPNFTDYIEPFSRITMDRFGNKLGVANATHDYAKYWTKEFVPVWRELGGEVAAMNPMDYNKSADFYTGVSKVLSEDPDVMFVGGASEPTGLVVRQARELGFKGGFILMDQAKMDEVAKVSGGIKSLEGSVGVVPLDKYENEGAKLFLKKWQEDHNGVATSETAYNYFAMYLIAQAMQEAGTVDDAKAIRAAIASAMDKVSVEHNPYDVDGIDEAGNLGADPQIAEVVDGEVVLRKLSEITE